MYSMNISGGASFDISYGVKKIAHMIFKESMKKSPTIKFLYFAVTLYGLMIHIYFHNIGLFRCVDVTPTKMG